MTCGGSASATCATVRSPKSYDFTGRFQDGMLLFEDDDISGDTYFVGDDTLVLP